MKWVVLGMIMAIIGDLAAAYGYGIMKEWKLMIVFLLYAVSSLIFATIEGSK